MDSKLPIQLIQKIVHRDRGAFERFYDRFAPLVFSLALKILLSRPDAEETVQDVFYKVWTHAKSFDSDRGKVETWLMTLTRSKAIDRLRVLRRRRTHVQDLDPALLGEAGIVIRDTSSESDARITNKDLLADIPRAQREVLELAYLKGMTQSEISRKTGIPLGTVKTRIRDGMRWIREHAVHKDKAGIHVS